MSIRKIKRRTLAALRSTKSMTIVLTKDMLAALRAHGGRSVHEFVSRALRDHMCNHLRITARKD